MPGRVKNILSSFSGNSGYFKDIFSQTGLVVLAQLIPVIFSPILSRIYEENAMAEITGLMAFSSLLLMFSTFKLENAIVVEPDDNAAQDLIVLTSVIAAIFTVLTVILTLFFSDFVIEIFKVESVINYLPGYIFLFSLLNTLNFWYVRIGKFRMKAYSKIFENAGYVAIAIGVYFFAGSNEYGLAAGKIAGVLIALVALILTSQLKLRCNVAAFIPLLKKHREFPLHYMPSSFVNTMGLQILVLFIGAYFQKEDLGYFGLANMVIIMPVSVMTQSVGTIFFQKTSEYVNKGKFSELKKTFFQTAGILSLVAIPGFLILFFGSKRLFPLIFGENWYITGIIAEFLSFVFLTQVIVGPLSIVLVSLKKMRFNAIWQYGRFGGLLLYMLCLVYYFKLDFMDFVRWYSYGAAFLYVVYLILIYTVIRKLRDEI